MTKQEIENLIYASYEVENQAKKVARNTMNKLIREYITTITSNEIIFNSNDEVEYHVTDSQIPYYFLGKLEFKYNNQNYIVTVYSTNNDVNDLLDTDLTYNMISDIIFCQLNDSDNF